MEAIAFYAVTSLSAISGLILMATAAGWPSPAERKDMLRRSLKNSAGAVLTLVGLVPLISVGKSPSGFLDAFGWSAPIATVILIIIPFFLLMVVGSYVQFTAWEKGQLAMRQRTRKILQAKSEPEPEQPLEPSPPRRN
jgi:cytochrome c-type biogenesis protein CcmH/NrfG